MFDKSESRPGPYRILVLQGGGALGAYQAGAYAALAEQGYAPDWVAGISIGAINGAIIAGNRPENRVARLRDFWNRVTSGLQCQPFSSHVHVRNAFNGASALMGLAGGAPGFFTPRLFPPVLTPAATPASLGYYSSEPLRETLRELVDFDCLAHSPVRLSVGAVNIRTGNFTYFDSAKQTLGVEHVMASGALPPGLPPIEIDGDYYWDGGVVSNTPLQYVLDEPAPAPALSIFQVDLFSAEGQVPETLLDAAAREKEIRYSSRTRLSTDMLREKVKLRRAMKRVLRKLPANLRDDPDVKLLAALPDEPEVSVMHLIHSAPAYEGHARDYDFSRVSMAEHWEQGRADVAASLSRAAWAKRGGARADMVTYDLARGEKVK
ncbi:patatin-like phospholipase family protein [Aestuariivirga sp.]|uniref:patatin-like phospholipase family protein n=1 Tax=Aestuariivirga sp. TaxID=2650926 RepID=UPI0039E2C4D0